jgi:O-antigen/teichoic acid export membrane protein
VLPIFNVLPSLTSSVSLSAIPSIAEAISRGEDGEAELRDTSRTSFGLVCAVAIPASLGLCVFSGDILSLLDEGNVIAKLQATAKAE